MNRSILAVLLLVSACGGNGGAPILDAFVRSSSILLQWTHPAGQAEGGYAVELRFPPAAFQVTEVVPFSKLETVFLFPPGAPEEVDYELRVRALPDDDGSRASNAIRLHRGLATPTLDCQPQVRLINGLKVCDVVNGVFHLTLVNDSRLADSLELIRSGGTSGTKVIRLPATTTSYDDADLSGWVHNASLFYQLTALKGTERSSSSVVITTAAPP
jgi:hypothetical protein